MTVEDYRTLPHLFTEVNKFYTHVIYMGVFTHEQYLHLHYITSQFVGVALSDLMCQ